ncbi:hypothetical protein H920_09366 [Fukomys damarensis]|uniref:Uncharacterized protein n=1 Tax=Fukomys damarensis TaxID=885580 RepID=A0A091DFI4_FUKDA|nr:hypothetical protein H920_09366 [Fukomys damarensis]
MHLLTGARHSCQPPAGRDFCRPSQRDADRPAFQDPLSSGHTPTCWTSGACVHVTHLGTGKPGSGRRNSEKETPSTPSSSTSQQPFVRLRGGQHQSFVTSVIQTVRPWRDQTAGIGLSRLLVSGAEGRAAESQSARSSSAGETIVSPAWQC